jgi:hypothetical protein
VQSITDAVTSLVCSVASVLVGPTVLLLVFRRLVPSLGDAVWRGYCQLLIWLVKAPIQLIRLLVHEAVGRRRR